MLSTSTRFQIRIYVTYKVVGLLECVLDWAAVTFENPVALVGERPPERRAERDARLEVTDLSVDVPADLAAQIEIVS